MTKTVFVLLLLLASSVAVQCQGPVSQNARRMYSGTATPTWNCSPGPIWRDYYTKTTDNSIWQCSAAPNTWTKVVGGGVPGTVTSVSGTANQISVATGTTTPVLSFPTGAIISENFVSGLTSTATAAGTTTLTVASKRTQVFTGSTTQTVTLPVVTTLPQVGFSFDIQNDSSEALTINSSGGNLVQTMAAGTRATFTCKLLTGTDAASWNVTNFLATTSAGAALLPNIDGATVSNSAFTAGAAYFYSWNGRTVVRSPADGRVVFTNNAENAGAEVNAGSFSTYTNCSDSAGAAACGSAAAGSVVIDAAATSVVVSTTAITANSQIFIQNDSSLGTRLGVTCNTQSSLVLGTPRVTARTAGTSFTVTIEVGPTTNPMCLSYYIIN